MPPASRRRSFTLRKSLGDLVDICGKIDTFSPHFKLLKGKYSIPWSLQPRAWSVVHFHQSPWDIFFTYPFGTRYRSPHYWQAPWGPSCQAGVGVTAAPSTAEPL